MDICANFLVFLLGCLVLQCLNHILMTDSLLHMKRSALSCHEKKTWKNKTRPESTRPTGPISSRTLETVYSIMTYTQYIYIAYTSYHNPYTTCTQNVHSLNRFFAVHQYLGHPGCFGGFLARNRKDCICV